MERFITFTAKSILKEGTLRPQLSSYRSYSLYLLCSATHVIQVEDTGLQILLQRCKVNIGNLLCHAEVAYKRRDQRIVGMMNTREKMVFNLVIQSSI